MAKFRQGHLILKNDKKISFGDAQEVEVYHDANGLKISGQQIGRYTFISSLANNFELDDTDVGASPGKVFSILRTLDFNESDKGSAFTSFSIPDGFDDTKDINTRIIYSLNGSDPSKVVKLTTSIWCSDFLTTPGVADYTYSNTISSSSDNIGKLSRLVLTSAIIPIAAIAGLDKYIIIKHTREASDVEDTYVGTYQLIAIQFYQYGAAL